MKLLISIFSTIAAVLSFSTAAIGAELPFNQVAFDQAVKTGKPVVVDFAADWCPVCRAQKPVISAILQAPEMAGVTLFVANFDTESGLKKALRVNGQSTLVVFKAGKEVARSTGQTHQEPLQALLAQAL